MDAESDIFDLLYITPTYFNPAYNNVLSEQQEELVYKAIYFLPIKILKTNMKYLQRHKVKES